MMATGPLQSRAWVPLRPAWLHGLIEQRAVCPFSVACQQTNSFRFPELNCSRVEFITTHFDPENVLHTI